LERAGVALPDDAAKAGEEVSLPGFGKFKVADRPAREGRNPATGATLTIAASKKVSFTMSRLSKPRSFTAYSVTCLIIASLPQR